jgi:hypothetical protein
MRLPPHLALVLIVALTACTSVSPSATPTTSDAPIATQDCPAFSLRSPAGANVNLSGLWRGPDAGTYFIRHSGSCVWIVGLSADTHDPSESDSSWTNSFFGHLAPDFTLSGQWADIPWGRARGIGQLTWGIQFDQVGGVEAVTLQAIESTGDFEAGYLVRIPPDAEVNLTVQLLDSDACAAVVSEAGETYELGTLPEGWAFSPIPRLYGPAGEEINLTDPFTVVGVVARGNADCGPGVILFPDIITVPSAPG